MSGRGFGEKSGAKLRLTPDLMKEIEQLIIAGNYAGVACAAVGISEASYYLWLQKGREDKKNGVIDSIYYEFLDTIKKAEAIAESNAVIRVDKSARSGNVESAKWFLERKFYKRWGKNDKTEHTIKGGLDLKINFAALSDEELDKLNKDLEKELYSELNNATNAPAKEFAATAATSPLDEGENRGGN
jgi:hypothetical protein